MPPGFAGIHHLALFTHDLDETLDFYRRVLGLEVSAIAESPRGRHAFIHLEPADSARPGLHFWENATVVKPDIKAHLASFTSGPGRWLTLRYISQALRPRLPCGLGSTPTALQCSTSRSSEHSALGSERHHGGDCRGSFSRILTRPKPTTQVVETRHSRERERLTAEGRVATVATARRTDSSPQADRSLGWRSRRRTGFMVGFWGAPGADVVDR